jgi:hypothetical protein
MNTRRAAAFAGLVLLGFAFAASASAQDLGQLKQEVLTQKAAIDAQRKALDEQTRRLEELTQRLNALEGGAAQNADPSATKVQGVAAVAAKPGPTPPVMQEQVRDSIGDLNAEQVRRGEFPGSFRVGRDDKISLGFGGFIKAAAYYDNNFELGNINPLPQLYGLLGQDTRGGFNLDASLSRFNVDGRASVAGGRVRGYLEFDFANSTNFKLRHAYLTYSTKSGTLTAGQTWSQFMDLRSVPEAVSEPVTSGLVFIRQPQIGWSSQFKNGFNYGVSAEQSGGTDVLVLDADAFRRNNLPDLIGKFGYNAKGGHFQVAGLLRKHEIFPGQGERDSAFGSGVSVGAGVAVATKNYLSGSFTYGKGISRYLVGLDPISSGYFHGTTAETAGRGVPARLLDQQIYLRTNYGGFIAYKHIWNDKWRSNFYGGFAKAPSNIPIPGLFKSTRFLSVNALYRINPYLTWGVEYMYGTKSKYFADPTDNHRILIGFQLY